MRTMIFLLEKEFKQIFRDPILLKMILIMPIVQLLIIPLAADFEIKNIAISVVDQDRSPSSQKLISKITSSGYFELVGYETSYKKSFDHIEHNIADLVLEIPPHFERNLIREGKNKLFIGVNAINGSQATVGATYLTQIISDFNRDINMEWVTTSSKGLLSSINIVTANRFNQKMNYHFFMVPAILAILITISGFMCALNIVREKEIGTIEQINVTPIKKLYFILGKLIPFWLIGVFMFSIGLLVIARWMYQIIPAGSIPLLYSYLALYLVVILGIGLLISTYSNSQQQAVSLSFFFMIISILMSGIFTPIQSMPEWAQFIAYINPLTYFADVMRMVILKGSSFYDITNHFAVMTGFALFFNAWAIINYKKTT